MYASLRRPLLLSTAMALVAALGAGCATARDPWFDRMLATGQVEPASEVERTVLARMDELPPDAPTSIEGKRVVAGATYVAASGRVCRSLSIEGSMATLACREAEPADADEDEAARVAWFIAPDVFGPAPTETAATAEADAEARGVGEGAP